MQDLSNNLLFSYMLILIFLNTILVLLFCFPLQITSYYLYVTLHWFNNFSTVPKIYISFNLLNQLVVIWINCKNNNCASYFVRIFYVFCCKINSTYGNVIGIWTQLGLVNYIIPNYLHYETCFIFFLMLLCLNGKEKRIFQFFVVVRQSGNSFCCWGSTVR